MSKAWPLVNLGELLKLERRPVKVVPEEQYAEIGIYCFGRGIFHKLPRSGFEVGNKDLFLIKEGDLILQVTFAWEGAVALSSTAEDGMYGSTRYPTFRVDKSKCFPPYLVNYFKTKEGREQLVKISPGSAGRNRVLSLKRLPEVFIPLPPLSEQRRIVAKIEELAGKIEEARGVRQQMIKGTEALWHASLKSIISKGLMDRWDMKPISEVTEISPSKQDISACSNDMQVSFVPMSALDDLTGRIVKPETRQIGEVKKGYTYFANGDVIFARITPCMQNGKSAIARDLINGIGFGSTEFHVMRPKTTLLAEWLHVIVRHKDFKDDATAHFKGTAGQQRVPQSFLEKKLIPIPPISEQLRIVSYLDNLQSKIDDLRRIQSETQKELHALIPSILDKAFKGEL
jgi:type I restriction enzyme S subunit